MYPFLAAKHTSESKSFVNLYCLMFCTLTCYKFSTIFFRFMNERWENNLCAYMYESTFCITLTYTLMFYTMFTSRLIAFYGRSAKILRTSLAKAKEQKVKKN